uniref:Uncharacterized protein n=1 Tax=Tanacetum cinerariifolium TaxID=118510 RepID=A0A699GT20_TANCI|nr:hypothetical protein [Tanacetum cinerariifolium]
MDFAKPVKAISLPQDVPSTSDRHLIELENQFQRLTEARLSPKQYVQVNKITSSFLEVLAHAPIYNAILDKYVESLKLGKNGSAFIQGEMPAKMEDLGLFTLPCKLGDSKPFDTLADLGSCEFLNYHLPREWEIARDDEIDPFKDLLVFRRMIEFLGALPINLKGNMWGSEDLIEKPINWDKPPKNEDGAWHAKIRLIDPDEERFTKTFQSIPTSRKLFEKENPREIIDLDHFHNTWTCDSESSYKTR